MNALWINAGAGWDHSFTNRLFLRVEALYGYRLPSDMEQKLGDQIKDLYLAAGKTVSAKTRPGHGLTLKVAIGYGL
jgi:hypothetical protein